MERSGTLELVLRAAAEWWLLWSGCALTVVCVALLGPRGALASALVCTLPFMLLLAGFRWEDEGLRGLRAIAALPHDRVTRFGKVHIVHSHHAKRLRRRGKEFRLGNRHFCTGCYGLLFGTLLGDTLAISYLVGGFAPHVVGAFAWLAPALVVPIAVRYAWGQRMPAPLRFLANACLTLGCWLLLIAGHARWANALVNGALLATVVAIGLVRSNLAASENQRLSSVASRPAR